MKINKRTGDGQTSEKRAAKRRKDGRNGKRSKTCRRHHGRKSNTPINIAFSVVFGIGERETMSYFRHIFGGKTCGQVQREATARNPGQTAAADPPKASREDPKKGKKKTKNLIYLTKNLINFYMYHSI